MLKHDSAATLTFTLYSSENLSLTRYHSSVFTSTKIPLAFTWRKQTQQKKAISLLRSPHANKNAQEHFALTQIARIYKLTTKNRKNFTVKTFLKNLTQQLNASPEISGMLTIRTQAGFRTRY
jgi:ribosomal protein S10